MDPSGRSSRDATFKVELVSFSVASSSGSIWRCRLGSCSISKKGFSFIARWEGTRLTPYNDAVGYCTVGVGHLLHRSGCTNADKPITQAQALQFLDADSQGAESAVRSQITVILKTWEFDALASFTFNVGTEALRKSELRTKLNAGQKSAVPGELMEWVNAGRPPRRVQGLVNRRQAESILWSEGRYT